MRRFRLRTLIVAAAAVQALLTLTVCLALSVMTNIMAGMSERLIYDFVRGDKSQIASEVKRIETWSDTADYYGYGVAAFVVLGTSAMLLVVYLWIFRPLLTLGASMKAFTSGDEHRRAKPSRAVELANTTDTFNEMADLITGQHTRLIQFLSDAAQELKDPLDRLKGNLQALTQGGALPEEKVLRSKSAEATAEVHRLESKVQTYLDVGRTEWMRLDLQLGRLDLRETVRDVMTMYEAYSPVHFVRLALPSEPMWVNAPPSRLAQALYTLVGNAIQHSPNGGVIEVIARAVEGEAVVEVVDHGVGIPDQEMKRLFEPNGSEEHGVGAHPSVGMSIAKRLIQAMKGRIEVATELGEGSTFTVYLPLAAASSPKVAAQAAQKGPSAGQERAGEPEPTGTAFASRRPA